MEQSEIPLEDMQEHVEKHTSAPGVRWILWVALMMAILVS